MEIGTSMTLYAYGWKFKFQQEKENIMKVTKAQKDHSRFKIRDSKFNI